MQFEKWGRGFMQEAFKSEVESVFGWKLVGGKEKIAMRFNILNYISSYEVWILGYINI